MVKKGRRPKRARKGMSAKTAARARPPAAPPPDRTAFVTALERAVRPDGSIDLAVLWHAGWRDIYVHGLDHYLARYGIPRGAKAR